MLVSGRVGGIMRQSRTSRSAAKPSPRAKRKRAKGKARPSRPAPNLIETALAAFAHEGEAPPVPPRPDLLGARPGAVGLGGPHAADRDSRGQRPAGDLGSRRA